jgi:hypothetical protein
MSCRVVRAGAWKVDHDFLVMPGAERMRNALSTRCQYYVYRAFVRNHERTFVSTLVHQLHHHIDLVDSSAIEMLAHIHG